MKVLILCNTPYQIMVSIQLVNAIYTNDCVDILLADTMANVDRAAFNLRKTNIFRNVYVYYPKQTFYSKCKPYYLKVRFLQSFSPKKYLDNLIEISESYNVFLFVNLCQEASIIYRVLKYNAKKDNCKLQVFMFEDGFATYTKHYSDYFKGFKSIRRFHKTIFKRITQEVFLNIKGLYIFNPHFMDWAPDFPLIQIPKIDINDSILINSFNLAFDYKPDEDIFQRASVIYFEESYYADGIDVNDEFIVNKIIETVGTENTIIKLHPRNVINRFKDLDIITNNNTIIPWEIIALNIDISNKILVTIASGSALTSLVNTSKNPKKIIMFMSCKEIDVNKLTPSVKVLTNICKVNNEVVCLPNSINDAINTLKKLLNKEE